MASRSRLLGEHHPDGRLVIFARCPVDMVEAAAPFPDGYRKISIVTLLLKMTKSESETGHTHSPSAWLRSQGLRFEANWKQWTEPVTRAENGGYVVGQQHARRLWPVSETHTILPAS